MNKKIRDGAETASCLAAGFYKKAKEQTRPFLILFFCYLLTFYPLFRANIDYIDDMQRKTTGVAAWEYFSRFTSNFLSGIIHTNSYLGEISPLPQVIALLLLSVSGIILLYMFSGTEKLSFWRIIPALLLGINPYFLECMSYKYDAPYMGLSLLASIAPLLLWEAPAVLYAVTVMGGTLVMCTTYQAASGVFPILVTVYAFYKWNTGEELKKLLRLILTSVCGYLAGLLIFRLFIMVPVDTYAGSNMFSLREMPAGVYANLQKYYRYVQSDFDRKWLVLIALLCLLSVVSSVLHSRRSKGLSLLLAVLVLLAVHLMAFGLYPALSAPLFRARAMYGYGAMLAILGVSAVSYRHNRLNTVVLICLTYCFCVFTFLYANALNEQHRFEKYRMEILLNDLNTLDIMQQEGEKNLQITGGIGYSPIVTAMPQYQGLLKRLIQITFAGSTWHWQEFYFRNYYELYDVNKVSDLKDADLPLITDNYYQTIYGEGNNILVVVKNKKKEYTKMLEKTNE